MTTATDSSVSVCRPSAKADRVAPSGRRLAVNFLLLSVGEFAAKLMTFAGFLYLGRVLGPEGYGCLEFVLATMVFFTLPVDFGLGAYGAREIARDRSRAAALLHDIAALRLVLAGISFALLLLVVAVIPEGPEVKLLLALYGLSLFAAPALLQWFFQGHDQMHWVALVTITRQGVFAGLLVLFFRPGTALPWVGVLECVSVAVAAAVCWSVARSCLHRPLPPPLVDVARLRRHIGAAAPIGLSELAWAFLWYFATVLLGLLVGGEALGWFGAAHRVVMALHTFVWLYFFNLLPALARCAALPDNYYKALVYRSLVLTTWGGLFVALVLTVCARDLLALTYGPRYAGAAGPFAVLVWMVPVALLSGHYRYTLIAFDGQRSEFVCTAVAAAACVGLGLVFIPAWGAVGASTVLLVSGTLNLALAFAFARRRVPAVGWPTQVSRPLVATAVALGVFWLFPEESRWTAAASAVLAYVALFATWGRRHLTILQRS